MHFIVIKDEYKKHYMCIKTPYLAQIHSVWEEHDKRYKIKIFFDNYTQRILKLFYVKYLLANGYKFRKNLFVDFFK